LIAVAFTVLLFDNVSMTWTDIWHCMGIPAAENRSFTTKSSKQVSELSLSKPDGSGSYSVSVQADLLAATAAAGNSIDLVDVDIVDSQDDPAQESSVNDLLAQLANAAVDSPPTISLPGGCT
jgi:ABC-type sugar transport system substrate-binding protein